MNRNAGRTSDMVFLWKLEAPTATSGPRARWSEVVGGLETNHMTNTTSSVPGSVSHKVLNSPMRDLVRAMLYMNGGEASLSGVRHSINSKFDTDYLPGNWRVQVRDVLKHDPEIEKTEEDTWVLRIPGFNEA